MLMSISGVSVIRVPHTLRKSVCWEFIVGIWVRIFAYRERCRERMGGTSERIWGLPTFYALDFLESRITTKYKGLTCHQMRRGFWMQGLLTVFVFPYGMFDISHSIRSTLSSYWVAWTSRVSPLVYHVAL